MIGKREDAEEAKRIEVEEERERKMRKKNR